MDTNKNSYIFIYASVMVIIVAFLMAFVSSSLKPIQQKNVDLDKKKQILSALNIVEKDNAAAEAAYDKYIKAEQLLNADGTVKSETGAFAVESSTISEDVLPLYVCEVEGETKYVIPLFGAGLWNVIWGYVALNDDKSTIYGVYFSHAGETPGLGADIATPKFQNQFPGKIAVKDGKPVISVVKFGKVQDATCEVDGISGGTITSVGVDNMLHDGLGLYKGFLAKGACDAECAHKCENQEVVNQ